MTTLISYSNMSGEHRRCDAKCYDAKGDVCTCVCGGMNHSKGKDRAVENTREWVEGLAEQGYLFVNGKHRHPNGDVIKYDRQLVLF